MSYVFPAREIPSLEVMGSDARYPIHRIYCVGRNYLDHIREMGNDEREPPFFFSKPADYEALLPSGGEFPYPAQSSEVHFEIELVVAIGKGGSNITPEQALEHVYGYAVGIDMTRRDLQSKAKKAGKPWEVAKGFDHAAPCSAVASAADIGHPDSGAIWLKLNGEMAQNGDLAQQIWSVPETIGHLSTMFELVPGDLIYTGTPAGVGPVKKGDVMHGGIDRIGEIEITVV